jgi:hypothetical protein
VEQDKTLSMYWLNGSFQTGFLVGSEMAADFFKANGSHGDKQGRDRFLFLTTVSRLKGSSYIKHACWEEAGADIGYELEHSNSTESYLEYNAYFATKNKVCKLLLDNTVYLFKELSQLHKVRMTIPYHFCELIVEAERSEIEKHFQIDLSEMKNGHRSQFHMVYPDRELQRFIYKFVKVIKKQ